MEAGLAHPAFEPYRRWLRKLKDPLRASLDELNALAREADIRVESGAPVRFVVPSGSFRQGYGSYELEAFETGRVQTRPGNRHDLFNALVWLAFPRTKAKLNALHARAIPLERGRRGRLRDLLTLLDEGGAIVACGDDELVSHLQRMQWKALFWFGRERLLRNFALHVIGHAVLERACAPWPGIVCKALVVPPTDDPDALAARALAALPADATPRALPPIPVFGYPGWHPETAQACFYDDTRYFRTSRAR